MVCQCDRNIHGQNTLFHPGTSETSNQIHNNLPVAVGPLTSGWGMHPSIRSRKNGTHKHVSMNACPNLRLSCRFACAKRPHRTLSLQRRIKNSHHLIKSGSGRTECSHTCSVLVHYHTDQTLSLECGVERFA